MILRSTYIPVHAPYEAQVFSRLTSALWVVMVDPSALASFPTPIVVHARPTRGPPSRPRAQARANSQHARWRIMIDPCAMPTLDQMRLPFPPALPVPCCPCVSQPEHFGGTHVHAWMAKQAAKTGGEDLEWTK